MENIFNRNKNTEKKEEVTKDELFSSLIDDYTTVKKDMILQMRKGRIEKSVFLQDAREHMERYFSSTEEIMNEVMNQFEQYVFGYSRLTPLIDAPDISDIRCIYYDNIRMKENGKRKDSGVRFRDAEEYKSFIEFVATKNQVSTSNLNAIQRFSDNRSSDDFILRFTIAMPLVNMHDEPYMHIRKVPKNFPEIEDLVKKEMMTPELAKEIVQRFRSGSTLICGGNSSGKTTLLNALKETLPHDMSVLVSQQVDELTTKRHPDMMFMHSLPGIGESKVSYDLEDISIAGLTMDVDYFIVGEVKGAEALYVINAVYTGQLCAATIHAPSAEKAPDKLVDYAMYKSRYSRDELMKMLSCFKNIIFMKKYKVEQVYEVVGWNAEKKEIEYAPVYERSR